MSVSDEHPKRLGYTEGWTPVERRDTRPEVAEKQRELWLAMSGVERATEVLRWGHTLNCIRYERIRGANPGASEREVLALYTEETYRDSVSPERLADLSVRIRAAAPLPRGDPS